MASLDCFDDVKALAGAGRAGDYVDAARAQAKGF